MDVVLDTYSLLYRAHHALPPMSTAAGEPTSALYGLSALLVKLLRERRPSGLAFAVDAPGASAPRAAAYAGYKAGRAAAPDPLRAQLRRLPELFAALGAPALAAAGQEADDVIATLAREAREAGRPLLAVSGDHDLFQVARGCVRLLFVGARAREPVEYDEAAVVARYGLPVERLPAYCALVGDPGDNLPGVPGVGPKTAAAWVARHGTVAAVLAAVDSLEPARLRPALVTARGQVLLNERLVRLDEAVPLDRPRFAPVTAAALSRLRAWFTALEFRSLLSRLDPLGT